MSETVKRYNLRQNMPATATTFLPDVVVSASDYARLEQECERLRAELENAHKQVNSECQDWAREYEARRKAVEEREMLSELLREIAVGISKREMPTEQQLNEWFDRIESALSTKP